jgi:hypothetical protein
VPPEPDVAVQDGPKAIDGTFISPQFGASISLAAVGDCSELHCQTGIDRCPAGCKSTRRADSAGTF